MESLQKFEAQPHLCSFSHTSGAYDCVGSETVRTKLNSSRLEKGSPARALFPAKEVPDVRTPIESPVGRAEFSGEIPAESNRARKHLRACRALLRWQKPK